MCCFKCYFNTHVCLEDEFFACLLAVNSGPVDFVSRVMPPFKKDVFADVCSAQIKTLSFLGYMYRLSPVSVIYIIIIRCIMQLDIAISSTIDYLRVHIVTKTVRKSLDARIALGSSQGFLRVIFYITYTVSGLRMPLPVVICSAHCVFGVGTWGLS